MRDQPWDVVVIPAPRPLCGPVAKLTAEDIANPYRWALYLPAGREQALTARKRLLRAQIQGSIALLRDLNAND